MSARAGGWLDARAAATPAALALETEAGRFTWGDLARRARAASEHLRAAGVRAGERVGLWLPPGAGFVCALHAIWRLGAIAAPCNLRLPEAQAWSQLAQLAPRVVLRADANTPELFAEVAPAEARAQAANAPLRVDDPVPAPGQTQVRGPARARVADAQTMPARTARAHAPDTHARAADAAQMMRGARAQDALALILFTSGTAGAPKAAALRFSNLEASARASAQVLGSDARERWLLCLPLFHIGGLSILVRAVLSGAAVVLHAGFDARRVSRALDAAGITCVSLVPTTLSRVLDARGARRAPQTLRTVLLGGAGCSAALLARARDAGFPVRASYGLTETASHIATADCIPAAPSTPAAGATLAPAEARATAAPAAADSTVAPAAPAAEARTAGVADAPAPPVVAKTSASASADAPAVARTSTPASAADAPAVARTSASASAADAPAVVTASAVAVGGVDGACDLRVLPGSALRIVDAAGRVLGAGETGEIQVRGPTVFAGYWNDAPATRAAFAGDWLRTGDLGALDARGMLRVAGRRDDLIITGGENVHPAQVEAVLLAHASVVEAAVGRLPDADLGQRVAAWVVPRAGAQADTASLLAHCRARLAGYQQPREVFWVDALPRTALGKVQRRLLDAPK